MKSFSGVQRIAILKAVQKLSLCRALTVLSINFRIHMLKYTEDNNPDDFDDQYKKKSYLNKNSYLHDFVYYSLQNHICNVAGRYYYLAEITKIWLLSLSTEKVIWKRRHTHIQNRSKNMRIKVVTEDSNTLFLIKVCQ